MNSLPEANDVAEPAAGGKVRVGEVLARARRAVGLSVEDVARQLKFGARQIESLEGDRYDELPGSTIARGMVRNYARLVKIDPAPLMQQMAGLAAVPRAIDGAVSLRKPIPFSDSSRRVNLSYALLSLAVLGAVLAVLLGWLGDPTGGSNLTFVPAAKMSAEVAGSTPPVQTEGVPVATVGAPLALVAPAPAIAEPKTDAEPTPPAAAESAQRVTLRFDQASWVEVRGGDGRVLTSQLNAAGTMRVVEGAPPFRLVIGNARHVQLRYGERTIDLAQHVRLDVARLTLE